MGHEGSLYSVCQCLGLCVDGHEDGCVSDSMSVPFPDACRYLQDFSPSFSEWMVVPADHIVPGRAFLYLRGWQYDRRVHPASAVVVVLLYPEVGGLV